MKTFAKVTLKKRCFGIFGGIKIKCEILCCTETLCYLHSKIIWLEATYKKTFDKFYFRCSIYTILEINAANINKLSQCLLIILKTGK